MKDFGGLLTYRTHSDGTQSPYEVNIALYDALKGTIEGQDEWQHCRFLCSQAVMLALAGVPAIYYNSLLATPNYVEGVERTQRNRTINRRKWRLEEVNERLDNPDHPAHQVFEQLSTLITIRRKVRAFDPMASQRCLSLDPRLFILVRNNESENSQVVCLFNLSDQRVIINRSALSMADNVKFTDLMTGDPVDVNSHQFHLTPYDIRWLEVH